MRIIGVIPARYKSSRFPGKPLADICGKPMIWWVYQQAVRVEEFEQVCVATDDERIREVCESFDIPCIVTEREHNIHISCIQEVSEIIMCFRLLNRLGVNEIYVAGLDGYNELNYAESALNDNLSSEERTLLNKEINDR